MRDIWKSLVAENNGVIDNKVIYPNATICTLMYWCCCFKPLSVAICLNCEISYATYY